MYYGLDINFPQNNKVSTIKFNSDWLPFFQTILYVSNEVLNLKTQELFFMTL